MEIIDRYLQAVRFWLPKAQRQDILAELSEDIRSQMEERSAGLGHDLSVSEVEDLLVERGNPILVASRYLPQQYLIGPELYPSYSMVLKIASVVVLVGCLVGYLCVLTFTPSYVVRGFGALVGDGARGLWTAGVATFAAVTAMFALMQRYELGSGLLKKWNPRQLPPVHDFNRIKRSSAIAEMVALTVASLWWLAVMSSPAVTNSALGAAITFAPEWRFFWWGFLVLLAVNLALSATNLLHPSWTTARASVRLASDVLGYGLFAWLCKVNILRELHVAKLSYISAMEIVASINYWAARCAPIVVMVGAIVFAVDVYRIVRVGRAEG